ncbi:MAG: NAD(+) synthase [Ruminococcaceae bacterium]|nr:NAD(+) synthase [Oscillospiraceae bacterium]
MKHGYIQVAAASPRLRVADPFFNADEMIRLTRKGAEKGVRILVFPELALTGCTCKDLFFSEALLSGAKRALCQYVKETAALPTVSVVGLPLSIKNKLYNVAAVVYHGAILGFVPKTRPSANSLLADARYFQPSDACDKEVFVYFEGEDIPFGADLLFSSLEMPALRFAVEIGTDIDLVTPPSLDYSREGATLICHPTASIETVGASEKRTAALLAHSERIGCAYVSASAGYGESTTDLVLGGHCIITETDTLLAEKKPFSEAALCLSQPNLSTVSYKKRRKDLCAAASNGCRELFFSMPLEDTELTRPIDPHPFVPSDPDVLFSRCESILAIQTAGLMQRIEKAYAQKIVLGISGGLDSTLALLVMARAIDRLKRPRTDIIAVTMPCFGTTNRTKNNATVLCEELGVDFRCVDIFDAVNQHFADIGHDPQNRNVVYENAQARERTQILMDIANACGGMVIGTGDLSELALGWATYNGDQMSMYGVNADVPKTLVRHLVAHCALCAARDGNKMLADALEDVVNTPVSPELLPADEKGEIAQKTEDLVGPYEIHDFYLYYMLRYGYSPSHLYRLACYALGSRYDTDTLKKWLKVFIRRFFSQQFKRSCMPDGPKVGSVGLSPRGDWMMPSDASSALWQQEAEAL